MKKYKLEFSIVTIFFAFLVLLLWQRLSVISEFIPFVLIGVCVAVLAVIVFPFWFKGKNNSDNGEVYAPKYFAQAIVSSILGVVVIVFSAVILNKNNFSKTIDVTSNKINSLSDESNKFLDALSKQVEIYCVPSQNPIENYCDSSYDLINLFAKKSNNIINVGPIAFNNKEALQRVQPSGFSRLVLMTDNNKTEIDGVVTESRLTNALINLVRFKKIVYFLSGSGEPSISVDAGIDKSYVDIVAGLQHKSYEVKDWNIKQGFLPKDARVLIAGDNNIPYSEEVQNILKNFIAHGGRLVLIVNPFREQGLEKLYASLNLKLDPTLLMLNSKTPIGQQIAKQNLSRSPVIASNFSFESPITKIIAQVYGAQAVMLIDGGRPISVMTSEKKNSPLKTNASVLLTSFSAAPITLTSDARNRIDLNVPFQLTPDVNFDPNKSWPLAVSVDLTGVSKLADDPSAIKISDPAKDKSEVVVFGFSFVSPFSKFTPISDELLPVTVAHLYQDQELVTIPPRDFSPKQFNLSRNPGAWLPLFSGILPVFTAISGLLIWFRRRSA
ncbi:Gldg family protein [Spirobacillus cienkowskii]|jgi:hypothetical protein|uniref:Uncharacterized protein n=1 Tax=Spirobacillus cienkowskii TaxID=495820 RepID=A0A369KMK9_9BACT|nr:MAG: hypothetical protein DCC88_07920 [Spirobacillus cienkowskii]